MDSAAGLRSLNHSVCAMSNVRSGLERPCMMSVHNVTWPTISRSHIQSLQFGGKLVCKAIKQEGLKVSCLKISDTMVAVESDVLSDNQPQVSSETNYLRSATFPTGFEELVMEVCDETEIAELKLKVGDFEMHLKRKTEAPVPVVFSPPPAPSKLMIESSPTSPVSPPPKSSTTKTSPFTNVSVVKSAKLAALEASGSSGYVFVSSPLVGLFRRGRIAKGKRQPPICNEGNVIKKGQVIGYLDQFGSEVPVRSDVAGEVLKLLYDDGEAVGYGDPLIAVLPSFGIE